MRTAVSNLAWGSGAGDDVAEVLVGCGVQGVEVAPTAIWPEAPAVDHARAVAEAARWRSWGLTVVAMQSLLFGHPELRLFDPASHPALREHLTGMVRLAGALGCGVAVFGSPRNRVRAGLPDGDADARAAEFFAGLVPVLAAEGVVLTLEPNAPAYGADFMTTYEGAARVAELVDSPWVAPQVDTGCLRMVGVDPAGAMERRLPAHVHASAPDLAPPPGDVDHEAVAEALRDAGYPGWVTLEMRRPDDDVLGVLRRTAAWLVRCYGDDVGPAR